MSKQDTEKSIIASLLAKGSLDPNFDPQAQQGVGNVDYNQLMQMHPMQEGDKLHPLDAMRQIAGQMQGPQSPSGVSQATGPKIQAGANGELKIPSDNPILKLLGVKSKIDNPNYYEAAKAAGIDKYLPSGLAQMPDGTPFVGPKTFAESMSAHKSIQNPNNPPVSLQDAKDLDIISQKEYDKLLARGVKPTDEKAATIWRLSSSGRMASAKEGLVALGNSKMEQGMIQDLVDNISDATAKGPAATQANALQWAIHGRQIVSGAYNPDTKQYDLKPQQLAELTMDLNRILTGSSNTAEGAREEISAATAQGKFAKLAQFAGINDFNGTSQDLAKMYIQMLDRQGSTSNDLLNATLARQIPRGQLLNKLNPGAYKAVIENSFGTSDYRQFLQSLPDAQQTQVPPALNLGGRGDVPPQKKSTGAWKVIR